MFWKQWRDGAADLFLGSSCPGCGRPGWGACAECLSGLRRATPARTIRATIDDWPVWAACAYRPPVPALVKAWKDEGSWGLTRPFARAVLARIADEAALVGGGPCLVVPVPSRPQAVAERGHDHARSLARGVARGLGWRSEPLLRVGRGGADQFDLDREHRWLNSRGVRAQRGSGRVLLVDDVVTTGASLRAAAQALTEAGWTVVGAATVASSELRLTPYCAAADRHRLTG
ncbi:ComF family protein [Aestuariimicrobium soli]|uniref:ComF family protein n=1 Tax=Aestuariimicrobium soli TaxID=2035834 RepID=UPI003EC139F3